MRVLAVDDNPDNVQLISDILDGFGHEVMRAYNGRQALDIIKNEKPDLILLDVNMPDVSGFDVVKQLKSDEQTADIPVIMVTAQASVDYRVEGLGLGADDYLTKPFSPRELIARIETRYRTKETTDNLREAREVIQKTFERFVSPSIVKKMLDNPENIKLGGKLQEITVLFADMENFTTISESTNPETLLTVLNQYHALVVESVQNNGGTIDKFIGDAVMALYNTPVEFSDHALRAVQTACQIRDALDDFHQQFEEKLRMKINFGIHTGMAVVGDVGAPQIMDYTAVGDTVNVAARLQGLCRRGQILVSEATHSLIQPNIYSNIVGERSVKGRSEPIVVYDVLSIN